MRIIGPPDYQPNPPCSGPPWPSERMHRDRLRDDQRLRRQRAKRRLEARLRCPTCNDSLKTRLCGRWVCHHCLTEMVLP